MAPNPTLSISEPIMQAMQIVQGFMGLASGQVVFYNQGWKIPTDERMYISFGLLASRPYGSSRTYEDAADGSALVEVITLNTQEVWSINVYSYGLEAPARKEEVVMAFNSTAAEQSMEAYSYKLPLLPLNFRDLSGLEGSRRLYRFQADVAVLRARKRENIVQYYDKFDSPRLVINP